MRAQAKAEMSKEQSGGREPGQKQPLRQWQEHPDCGLVWPSLCLRMGPLGNQEEQAE